MRDTLYIKMAIPEACQLGKRVFKKLFYQNARLGATDKKAFREDIDTITWQYTLKPSTIPIKAYEDDSRDYKEFAVLHVDLRTRRRTARIAQVIHRTIPYPLLIVFAYEKLRALSTAHKRLSMAEKGAIVAEDVIITDWIDLSHPTPVQRDFLSSLSIADLPHTHFLAFYSAIVERLVALDCARLTGKYCLESKSAKQQARSESLAACHELEGKIEELRVAIRKEVQFNRQVELNSKLKQLESKLARKASEL